MEIEAKIKIYSAFSYFSMPVSKHVFNPKWKKVKSFFFLFTTSNAEPYVDPIVYVIEPAVKNLLQSLRGCLCA